MLAGWRYMCICQAYDCGMFMIPEFYVMYEAAESSMRGVLHSIPLKGKCNLMCHCKSSCCKL